MEVSRAYPRAWSMRLYNLPSLVAGMSRSPRQVDSRFILILVDVVALVVTTVVPGDDDDGDGGLEDRAELV